MKWPLALVVRRVCVTVSCAAVSGVIVLPSVKFSWPWIVSPEVRSTPNVVSSECDCTKLWECITAGSDCSELQAEMDLCLATRRSMSTES